MLESRRRRRGIRPPAADFLFEDQSGTSMFIKVGQETRRSEEAPPPPRPLVIASTGKQQHAAGRVKHAHGYNLDILPDLVWGQNDAACCAECGNTAAWKMAGFFLLAGSRKHRPRNKKCTSDVFQSVCCGQEETERSPAGGRAHPRAPPPPTHPRCVQEKRSHGEEPLTSPGCDWPVPLPAPSISQPTASSLTAPPLCSPPHIFSAIWARAFELRPGNGAGKRLEYSLIFMKAATSRLQERHRFPFQSCWRLKGCRGTTNSERGMLPAPGFRGKAEPELVYTSGSPQSRQQTTAIKGASLGSTLGPQRVRRRRAGASPRHGSDGNYRSQRDVYREPLAASVGRSCLSTQTKLSLMKNSTRRRK